MWCAYSTVLVVAMAIEARDAASVSVHSVHTIQPCTMSRHFMQSHMRREHECLAVSQAMNLAGLILFYDSLSWSSGQGFMNVTGQKFQRQRWGNF